MLILCSAVCTSSYVVWVGSSLVQLSADVNSEGVDNCQCFLSVLYDKVIARCVILLALFSYVCVVYSSSVNI